MPISLNPADWFETWVDIISGGFQKKLWISLFFFTIGIFGMKGIR